MSTELRRRLRERDLLFGAWTSFGHPSITEIFTHSGVDFVGIDLEHSTIDLQQTQQIIATAQAGGVSCLPRVSSHNGEQIRRLLDSGADGVIVPNVSRVSEIQQIVEWAKYPPEGKRSFGVARAQGYGLDFEGYVSAWNERSPILIQIESIAGVEAIDELLAHPAVDGVMVGPYDISGSLGLPGQLFHPRVEQACTRVLEACRRSEKACGTQLVDPTQGQIASAIEKGYTFIVLASDLFILWKWGERMKSIIKESQPRSQARAT